MGTVVFVLNKLLSQQFFFLPTALRTEKYFFTDLVVTLAPFCVPAREYHPRNKRKISGVTMALSILSQGVAFVPGSAVTVQPSTRVAAASNIVAEVGL